MLPSPTDYSTYRAALLDWEIEGIGYNRTIYVAETPYELMKEIKDHFLSYTELILDQCWESINCSDLEILFEDLNDENDPEKEWTVEDLRRELENSLNAWIEKLADNPDLSPISDEWYKYIDWINGCIPWNEIDRVQITIEDNLPNFVKRLLEIGTSHYHYSKEIKVSDKEAILLGNIAILASFEKWQWRYRETYLFFIKLAEEFSEHFSCI